MIAAFVILGMAAAGGASGLDGLSVVEGQCQRQPLPFGGMTLAAIIGDYSWMARAFVGFSVTTGHGTAHFGR